MYACSFINEMDILKKWITSQTCQNVDKIPELHRQTMYPTTEKKSIEWSAVIYLSNILHTLTPKLVFFCLFYFE